MHGLFFSILVVTLPALQKMFVNFCGHGEVWVYRGTGVSRGVRRTAWERSLENWELQIPCFEEFFWGGNTLGLVPASLPHALGYACTFYTPTSPPPIFFCLEAFGENSEENSGENSGRKFEKFRKLSFCNFSDLISCTPVRESLHGVALHLLQQISWGFYV